jgi:ubiquinone biosynthesis accessory factor UbiJ
MNDERISFSQSLLRFLEASLRKALALDPDAMRNVGRMAGKVIAVDLKGLERSVYVLPQGQGLRLLDHYDGEVHVRIRGTPLALLNMAVRRGQDATATFSGAVEIVGDLALGRHLQTTLAALEIDWEELLSHYVGDVAAHQLGNLGRGFGDWIGTTRHTLQLNTAEYIRDELEILPQVEDIQRFLNDVDGLRSDVDRLEARLQRLQHKLTPGPR